MFQSIFARKRSSLWKSFHRDIIFVRFRTQSVLFFSVMNMTKRLKNILTTGLLCILLESVRRTRNLILNITTVNDYQSGLNYWWGSLFLNRKSQVVWMLIENAICLLWWFWKLFVKTKPLRIHSCRVPITMQTPWKRLLDEEQVWNQ